MLPGVIFIDTASSFKRQMTLFGLQVLHSQDKWGSCTVRTKRGSLTLPGQMLREDTSAIPLDRQSRIQKRVMIRKDNNNGDN